MDYKIEELLPIVSELAQKYSGYESTSITYEKAQTLMEAVLYCLGEYDNAQENSLACEGISVKERYRTGLRLVCEKVEKIREIFNDMSSGFEDYGVKILYDTVQKGIPEFLKWYDVKYNPQNTILTLDYPLLADYSSLSGADIIYKYLCGIQIEQKFLKMFDKSYVLSVLQKYNPRYADMVENICDVVLTNTIGHVAIRKPFEEMGFMNTEYLQLTEIFQEKSVEEIEKFVSQTIDEIVKRFFEHDMDMVAYLCRDAKNIAVRIETASRFHQLHKVFL